MVGYDYEHICERYSDATKARLRFVTLSNVLSHAGLLLSYDTSSATLDFMGFPTDIARTYGLPQNYILRSGSDVVSVKKESAWIAELVTIQYTLDSNNAGAEIEVYGHGDSEATFGMPLSVLRAVNIGLHGTDEYMETFLNGDPVAFLLSE